MTATRQRSGCVVNERVPTQQGLKPILYLPTLAGVSLTRGFQHNKD